MEIADTSSGLAPRWRQQVWRSRRHESTTSRLRYHLVRLRAVFRDVFPRSLADWEHGFRCDRDPRREIARWLRLADAFEHFAAGRDLSPEQRLDLFAVIFTCASRTAEGLRFVLPASGALPAGEVAEIRRWLEDREGGGGPRG
jgi:hypothetical protein